MDIGETGDYRQHMSAPHVLSIVELDAAKHVLQRTRAVTVMAERMAAASSEHDCYAEVCKLLVALFNVSRSTVTLLTEDKRHVSVLQMAIVEDSFRQVLEINKSGAQIPLEGTVFGHISRTGELYYNPNLETVHGKRTVAWHAASRGSIAALRMQAC
jgi:hypothetical protein